ncbi:hypothetical protein BS50DRAFT_578546 [Corynespora cassiicola Philippines]|uniref:Mid2 domain-containing protein n=1 Tax=Corynespora cassiicola Philippines TaxID=1448308 RepID=A0A2T2N6R4_CORCC|nr:hypothetical protein BS50DRAFT_578546 [Corynespora cassiicola Philippines]
MRESCLPLEDCPVREHPLTAISVSLAQILLTAIPQSLRQIAATNLPAISSILWEEFLDDKRPEWFESLPGDIQDYLIRQFGPQSAWPTDPATNSGASAPETATATATATETDDSLTEISSAMSATSGTSRASSPSRSSDTTGFVTSVQSASTGSAETPSTGSTDVVSSSSSSSTSPTDESSSSSTSVPEAPPAGLSQGQKIGIGIGVPLAVLGAAALAFGCCLLCRRRRRGKSDGSIPPSSPGFIPRFAFQEKSTENVDHRTPLNPHNDHAARDRAYMNWDEDGIDPTDTAYRPHGMDNVINNGGVMSNDPKPIMAPALYHTHSSNRARGKRTSYQSLHSVAEVSEPDDLGSPIVGHHRSSLPRASPPRNLIPPPVPAAAQIRRKPVPMSPTETSPAAATTPQNPFFRNVMVNHDSSSSSGSGLGMSGSSGFNSSHDSGLGNDTDVTSPTSPASDATPENPFRNECSYVEDYGPEYQGGYVDVDDGLYGGHTSLARYPAPRQGSRTEWPLRNTVGKSHRRNKSPLWDRVYEN